MVDIAQLSIGVTGEADINSGAVALDNLAGAAGRAETAAQRLKRQHDELTRAQRQAASSTGNLAAQFQDVAVSIQGGQRPLAIALQQGTQISAVFEQLKSNGQSAGQAMAGAFKSVVSPVSLLTIGVIGLAAVTAQWLLSRNNVEKLSDVLKQQKDIVTDLGNAYANAAKNSDAFVNSTLANFQLRSLNNEKALRLAITNELSGGGKEDAFKDQIGTFVTPGRSAGGFTRIFSEFKEFEGPIKEFMASIKAGTPDALNFRRAIEERWALEPNNEALTIAAGKLFKWTDSIVEATEKLKQLEIIKNRLFNNVGPGGFLLSQGTTNREDMGNLAQFESQQAISAQRRQAQAAADLQRIYAKSPQEIASAVRAQQSAIFNNSESVRERQDRISIATVQALTEAEYKLAEARRERARAAQQLIEQAKLDISLIGATAGAQAAANYEFQKMAELRQEAARNNIKVNDAEAAAVHKTAEEYGKLVDIQKQKQLEDDLAFERSQIFRTAGDQSIASRLRGAGQPVDFNSNLAQMMKANQELQRMKDSWEGIFDTARSGIDSVFDSLFEGGKDFDDVIRNVGKTFAKLVFDMAVTNPLKNWLTGSELPNIGDLGIFKSGASSGRGGGFGGVLGNLLGAQKAVASMQVQAAVVNINGSALGGIPGIGSLLGGDSGFKADTTLSDILGGGSSQDMIQNRINQAFSSTGSAQSLIQSRIDQAFGTPSGGLGGIFSPSSSMASVAGSSAISNVFQSAGVTKTGIPLSQIGIGGLTAKVNAAYADRFQGLLTDLQKAGYPITSLGEGGYSFRNVAGTNNLSNHAFGNALDINPRQNPWAVGAKGNFSQYGVDPNELAKKNGLFWGGNWNKSDAMHFQVDKTAQSLDKLSTNSISASNSLTSGLGKASSGLSSLGSGLNQFGQNISSFMSSAQGGGSSWFSGLSGMFGGASGAFGFMNSVSPKATADIISGSWGLFHEGGRVGFATQFRNAPLSMFIGAPRYHGGTLGAGLAHDEMPAILRKGEIVSKDMAQARQMFGGGGGYDTDKIIAAMQQMRSNVKIVNAPNIRELGNYLRTDEGEELIMNIWQKNQAGNSQ